MFSHELGELYRLQSILNLIEPGPAKTRHMDINIFPTCININPVESLLCMEDYMHGPRKAR